MKLFPDRSHIRLKSHVDGLFLSAEEDGWGVSLAACRASINTAWQVHRVQRDGKSYVLLHSDNNITVHLFRNRMYRCFGYKAKRIGCTLIASENS